MRNAFHAVIAFVADRVIPRRYVEVHGDDNFCVMKPHEADAFIDEQQRSDEEDPSLGPEDYQTYTKRSTWMTRHRFENLPEFQGY